MPEPVKSEVLKRVRAASAVGALCTSREAFRRSIDVLCAQLDTYNLEIFSILRERETCAASVKELEKVLAAEESTDDEAEMMKEKEHYNAKRVVTSRQKAVEEEDEPIRGPGLLAKAQGKHPAK